MEASYDVGKSPSLNSSAMNNVASKIVWADVCDSS